jgi:hypothetical protein
MIFHRGVDDGPGLQEDPYHARVGVLGRGLAQRGPAFLVLFVEVGAGLDRRPYFSGGTRAVDSQRTSSPIPAGDTVHGFSVIFRGCIPGGDGSRKGKTGEKLRLSSLIFYPKRQEDTITPGRENREKIAGSRCFFFIGTLTEHP